MTKVHSLDIMQLRIFIDVALWLIFFCILCHILIFLTVRVSLSMMFGQVNLRSLFGRAYFAIAFEPYRKILVRLVETRKTLMKTSMNRPVWGDRAAIFRRGSSPKHYHSDSKATYLITVINSLSEQFLTKFSSHTSSCCGLKSVIYVVWHFSV